MHRDSQQNAQAILSTPLRVRLRRTRKLAPRQLSSPLGGKMLNKQIKITLSLFLVATIVSFLSLNIACADLDSKRTNTAKIIFSKNETGNLRALIIDYNSKGAYPKSGWTTCDIIDSDIVKTYSEKLKNQEKIEGYFIATYRKIEKDKDSPILRYKGELIKIEPWNPEFIKASK